MATKFHPSAHRSTNPAHSSPAPNPEKRRHQGRAQRERQSTAVLTNYKRKSGQAANLLANTGTPSVPIAREQQGVYRGKLNLAGRGETRRSQPGSGVRTQRCATSRVGRKGQSSKENVGEGENKRTTATYGVSARTRAKTAK